MSGWNLPSSWNGWNRLGELHVSSIAQLSLIKRFLDGVAGAVLGVQRMEAIVPMPRDKGREKYDRRKIH
jgi:hypothetical protein